MDRMYIDEPKLQQNDKDVMDAMIRSRIGKAVGVRVLHDGTYTEGVLIHFDGERIALDCGNQYIQIYPLSATRIGFILEKSRD